MELNEETTVKGLLIIINFALSWAVLKLWKVNQSDKKEFVRLIKDYNDTLKRIFTSKINE